jgi:hypothetical protein
MFHLLPQKDLYPVNDDDATTVRMSCLLNAVTHSKSYFIHQKIILALMFLSQYSVCYLLVFVVVARWRIKRNLCHPLAIYLLKFLCNFLWILINFIPFTKMNKWNIVHLWWWTWRVEWTLFWCLYLPNFKCIWEMKIILSNLWGISSL